MKHVRIYRFLLCSSKGANAQPCRGDGRASRSLRRDRVLAGAAAGPGYLLHIGRAWVQSTGNYDKLTPRKHLAPPPTPQKRQQPAHNGSHQHGDTTTIGLIRPTLRRPRPPAGMGVNPNHTFIGRGVLTRSDLGGSCRRTWLPHSLRSRLGTRHRYSKNSTSSRSSQYSGELRVSQRDGSECWLCAVCAVGRAGCCVGGVYPVGVSISSSSERGSQWRRVLIDILRLTLNPWPLVTSFTSVALGYKAQVRG